MNSFKRGHLQGQRSKKLAAIRRPHGKVDLTNMPQLWDCVGRDGMWSKRLPNPMLPLSGAPKD
jgi:hypothetical protein